MWVLTILTSQYSRIATVFCLNDDEFGLAFTIICSSVPFATKVCLNGRQWVKRQLEKPGIAFESLDDGFLSCSDPQALQEISNPLTSSQIEKFYYKWVVRLRYPHTEEDPSEGYHHRLLVWQFEAILTKAFNRPVPAKQFFEEATRDNLDQGPRDTIQVLFKMGLPNEPLDDSRPGLPKTVSTPVYT